MKLYKNEFILSEAKKRGHAMPTPRPVHYLPAETVRFGTAVNNFGTLKAFLPDELGRAIGRNGFKVKSCRALGSLANLCGKDTVDFAKQHPAAFQTFLDLCEDFDQHIMPHGPGTKQRAGLIAIAERKSPE